MTDEYALLDIEDDIATITLNDPERLNPWSEPMREGVMNAVEEARENQPRCLVIEGAGDAFSAGGDVDQMRRMIDSAVAHERATEIEEEILPAIRAIVRFPGPVIAKIDGAAAGLGANLAIACDILLASERSFIMFAFTNVGVSVDGGTSGLLPK
ncbi:enoyl-CoA hydratase/isomerase family protein, partial [Halobium palmae]